jgi:hypothetical protein
MGMYCTLQKLNACQVGKMKRNRSEGSAWGRSAAGGVDEEQAKRVKQLERMLGRKQLETEILKKRAEGVNCGMAHSQARELVTQGYTVSLEPGAFAGELRLGCADMCLAVSREVTFFGALHELGSCLAHRTACVIFGIVLVVCSECGNLSNHLVDRNSLG